MVNGEVSGGFAGITTSNSYNTRLFPTAISATSANGTALSLSYTYFANGSVDVETNGRDSGRTATYTYDALNRVSTAKSQATSGPDCWGQSFAYDRYANLTTITATQCSPPVLSLSVNANKQITNSGFTYDADGDLTADGLYTYSWNAENHLVSANGVTHDRTGAGYWGLGAREKMLRSALSLLSRTSPESQVPSPGNCPTAWAPTGR